MVVFQHVTDAVSEAPPERVLGANVVIASMMRRRRNIARERLYGQDAGVGALALQPDDQLQYDLRAHVFHIIGHGAQPTRDDPPNQRCRMLVEQGTELPLRAGIVLGREKRRELLVGRFASVHHPT